jgi:hypothetical protein
MPRGGKRPGAGRTKLKPEKPVSAPTKNLATQILESLGKPFPHKAKCDHKDKCECKCTCEFCLWKADAEKPGAEGSWARKYLWDRRDGKPVSTVNHLHDKPVELTGPGGSAIPVKIAIEFVSAKK